MENTVMNRGATEGPEVHDLIQATIGEKTLTFTLIPFFNGLSLQVQTERETVVLPKEVRCSSRTEIRLGVNVELGVNL
jgi:hypothetical protein